MERRCLQNIPAVDAINSGLKQVEIAWCATSTSTHIAIQWICHLTAHQRVHCFRQFQSSSIVCEHARGWLWQYCCRSKLVSVATSTLSVLFSVIWCTILLCGLICLECCTLSPHDSLKHSPTYVLMLSSGTLSVTPWQRLLPPAGLASTAHPASVANTSFWIFVLRLSTSRMVWWWRERT